MRRVRSALLFAAACAAWLVLLELACYAFLRWVPSPLNSDEPDSLKSMVSQFHPFFHPERIFARPEYYPYVGLARRGSWGGRPPAAPSNPDGWVLPLPIAGVQRYALPNKRPGAVRIIALGGSTMEGVGQSREDKRICDRLEALLREANPGRDIEVLNASLAGHIAAEEMVLLATKLVFFHPDLVLVLDGYNDVFRSYYFPELPPFWSRYQDSFYRSHQRVSTLPGLLGQLGLLLSQRLYCLAIPRALLHMRHRSGVLSEKGPTAPLAPDKAGPGQDPSFHMAPDEKGLDEYLKAHLNMLGIARAQGFPVILAMQPNVTYKKPLSEEESKILAKWNGVYPGIRDYTARYYAKADARYDRFIRKNSSGSARIYNLLDVFKSSAETLYIDSCHYNDRGAELLARALAPKAAAALGLKAP